MSQLNGQAKRTLFELPSKTLKHRVKVIFEVEKGLKTGNENQRDSEIKTFILTKEARWFRFLESNDTYDSERIENDKCLLNWFYNSVDFADCRIISYTEDLTQNKDSLSYLFNG